MTDTVRPPTEPEIGELISVLKLNGGHREASFVRGLAMERDGAMRLLGDLRKDIERIIEDHVGGLRPAMGYMLCPRTGENCLKEQLRGLLKPERKRHG